MATSLVACPDSSIARELIPWGGGDWRRHCSNPAWSEALQFLSNFAPGYNAYGWKPSSHQPGWLEQMCNLFNYLSICQDIPWQIPEEIVSQCVEQRERDKDRHNLTLALTLKRVDHGSLEY